MKKKIYLLAGTLFVLSLCSCSIQTFTDGNHQESSSATTSSSSCLLYTSRCGTAGKRPYVVFSHSGTSKLGHQRQTDIKSRLSKGCPREAVTAKAFQPAVDEFGVQVTFGGNKVDIILTQNVNNSHQYVACLLYTSSCNSCHRADGRERARRLQR